MRFDNGIPQWDSMRSRQSILDNGIATMGFDGKSTMGCRLFNGDAMGGNRWRWDAIDRRNGRQSIVAMDFWCVDNNGKSTMGFDNCNFFAVFWQWLLSQPTMAIMGLVMGL